MSIEIEPVQLNVPFRDSSKSEAQLQTPMKSEVPLSENPQEVPQEVRSYLIVYLIVIFIILICILKIVHSNQSRSLYQQNDDQLVLSDSY